MRASVATDDISFQFCATLDKFTPSCCRRPRQMFSSDLFCIRTCTL